MRKVLHKIAVILLVLLIAVPSTVFAQKGISPVVLAVVRPVGGPISRPIDLLYQLRKSTESVAQVNEKSFYTENELNQLQGDLDFIHSLDLEEADDLTSEAQAIVDSQSLLIQQVIDELKAYLNKDISYESLLESKDIVSIQTIEAKVKLVPQHIFSSEGKLVIQQAQSKLLNDYGVIHTYIEERSAQFNEVKETVHTLLEKEVANTSQKEIKDAIVLLEEWKEELIKSIATSIVGLEESLNTKLSKRVAYEEEVERQRIAAEQARQAAERARQESLAHQQAQNAPSTQTTPSVPDVSAPKGRYNQFCYAGMCWPFRHHWDPWTVQGPIDQGGIVTTTTPFNPYDGLSTYFSSHSWSYFGNLRGRVGVGSLFTVYDGNGNGRTYQVVHGGLNHRSGPYLYYAGGDSVDWFAYGVNIEAIAVQYSEANDVVWTWFAVPID